MSASYSSALSAAREAASSQHYPHGTLYMVATPIGNLADIGLRALHVLDIADAVACEDIRHTQQLMRSYGMERSYSRLLAVHQHNESEASEQVIARLRQGERVVYVSDAGTPGVSDPGARLVAHVQDAGLRCVPIPGASSVTALMSVAGVHADTVQGFVFAGFLPPKSAERAQVVQQLRNENRAIVLLEAPHRIGDAFGALAALGDRMVTVGRELTKQFEEIASLPASALVEWLQAEANRSRGEFVLVLHPATSVQTEGNTEGERVLALLIAELPLKTAVKLASEITGEGRNALYSKALELQKKKGPESGT